jgi:hypothetical protein
MQEVARRKEWKEEEKCREIWFSLGFEIGLKAKIGKIELLSCKFCKGMLTVKVENNSLPSFLFPNPDYI